MTAILHIEHPITDFDTWKKAFDQFADQRAAAGVRRHHLQRPHDDDQFIVIDLEFDTTEAAERFLSFLRNQVWSNRDRSPALAGAPTTRILEPVAGT